MISRTTVILFLLTVALWSLVYYVSWDFERPCREWRQSHAAGTSTDRTEQQPDGTDSVSFNPCNLWYAMPLLIKIPVLLAFVFTVAFLTSLVQDIARALRRRR
jgi:hypothetical protein